MRTGLLAAVILLPLVAVPLLAQAVGGRAAPAAAEGRLSQRQLEEAGVWHVVREGENLRSIARRYYGSGRYWRTVQLANDVGLTPNPGRRIWVPGHLPELP